MKVSKLKVRFCVTETSIKATLDFLNANPQMDFVSSTPATMPLQTNEFIITLSNEAHDHVALRSLLINGALPNSIEELTQNPIFPAININAVIDADQNSNSRLFKGDDNRIKFRVTTAYPVSINSLGLTIKTFNKNTYKLNYLKVEAMGKQFIVEGLPRTTTQKQTVYNIQLI